MAAAPAKTHLMNRLIPFCCLAAFLAACPRPIDFGPGGRIDDPAALLQKLDEEEARITSLTGDARLALQTPDGQGEVAMFVAVERPAKLHLESFDFFNRPIAAITSDGERFGLYDATEGRYYFGPATPQNLERFLRTPLSPAQVVALMLGSAPRDPNGEPSLSVDDRAEAYKVEIRSPTLPQLLWIDPLMLRAERSEWGGDAPLTARFGEFLRTGSVAFPKEIEVTSPKARIQLRLRYADVTLNKHDESMFVVEAPEGVPQIELDADGRPVAAP